MSERTVEINQPEVGLRYVQPNEELGYAKQARRFPENSPLVVFIETIVHEPKFNEILQKYGVSGGRYIVLDTGDQVISPAVEGARRDDKSNRTIYLTTGIYRRIKNHLREKFEVEAEHFLPKGVLMGIFMHEALHPGRHAPHAEEYKADEFATRALADMGFNPETYIWVLEALGDEFSDDASLSHPSATSRIERLRSKVVPQIRRTTQKFKPDDWDNSFLPIEAEQELTDLSIEVKNQRAKFTSPAEVSFEAVQSSKNLKDFWENYFLYSVRKLSSSACAESQNIDTGNFFITKLFVGARALVFFEKLQTRFPDVNQLFEVQYKLRESDLVSSQTTQGIIDQIEREMDIEGDWKTLVEYFNSTQPSEALEGIFETDQYREETVNILYGLLGYLSDKGRLKSGLAPLRNFVKKNAVKLAEQLSQNEEHCKNLIEEFSKGHIDVHYDRYADHIYQNCDAELVDGYIEALFKANLSFLKQRHKKTGHQFYEGLVQSLTELQKEWRTKRFTDQDVSTELYNYAFPLSSKFYIDETNQIFKENREVGGLNYEEFDVMTVDFSQDGTSSARAFLGIAFALGHTTKINELPRFKDTFINCLNADKRFCDLGQLFYEGMAYDNWENWYEAVSRLKTTQLRKLQLAINDNLRMLGVQTVADEFAPQKGYSSIMRLSNPNYSKNRKSKFLYGGAI